MWKIVTPTTSQRDARNVWSWAGLAALPMLVCLIPGAHAQAASHSSGDNVMVCNHALATPAMKTAIEQKADPAYIKQLAAEAYCVPLPPDVDFRIVKPIQVTTPTGPVNEAIGEVTLPDGSRSRFYIMQDDIDTGQPKAGQAGETGQTAPTAPTTPATQTTPTAP